MTCNKTCHGITVTAVKYICFKIVIYKIASSFFFI